LPLILFIQIFAAVSKRRIFSATEYIISAVRSWSIIFVPIESACDFLLIRRSNLGPISHLF